MVKAGKMCEEKVNIILDLMGRLPAGYWYGFPCESANIPAAHEGIGIDKDNLTTLLLDLKLLRRKNGKLLHNLKHFEAFAVEHVATHQMNISTYRNKDYPKTLCLCTGTPIYSTPFTG